MESKARRAVMSFVLFSLVIATGCASYRSRFTGPVRQEVEIILKENDFKMAAVNLEGSASVWYLFGVIPLGDERLFSRALADLYRPIEEQVVGRPVQLTNWTKDDTTVYVFLVGRRKVLFRADLLEFVR